MGLCLSADDTTAQPIVHGTRVLCTEEHCTWANWALWNRDRTSGDSASFSRVVAQYPWTFPIDDDRIQIKAEIMQRPREAVVYVWNRARHKHYEMGERFYDSRLLARHLELISQDYGTPVKDVRGFLTRFLDMHNA